jgi:putative ABC transport system permease protein
MQSRELGFNKEQKIVIPFKDRQTQNKFNVFSNEILKIKNVKGTGGCANYPSKNVLSDFGVYTEGNNMSSSELVKANRVNEDFFETMGIRIIAGRNLKSSDTSSQVVVNQKVLEALNIEKDLAVGSILYSDFEGNRSEFEIVGITNDYNFNSLRDDINPMVTMYTRRPVFMIVETNANDYNNILSDLGSVWKKTIPGVPFEYSFMDEDIQKQYIEENTLKKISNSFTVLAILISCLGLFGLAMFTAQQRIKEIGVRKVLGASVTGIATMLTRDFLKLVFISILIASPVAWWAMNKWLQDFAYKTDISWWVFVLAGVAALIIALITVSFQAIKAAIANPVKSLRSE